MNHMPRDNNQLCYQEFVLSRRQSRLLLTRQFFSKNYSVIFIYFCMTPLLRWQHNRYVCHASHTVFDHDNMVTFSLGEFQRLLNESSLFIFYGTERCLGSLPPPMLAPANLTGEFLSWARAWGTLPSLPPSLPSLPPSLPPSPPSLHSLPLSLPPSLPPSIHPSLLPPSLTYSLVYPTNLPTYLLVCLPARFIKLTSSVLTFPRMPPGFPPRFGANRPELFAARKRRCD